MADSKEIKSLQFLQYLKLAFKLSVCFLTVYLTARNNVAWGNDKFLLLKIDPGSGFFEKPFEVRIRTNRPAQIYYTLNQKEPSAKSPRLEKGESIKILGTSVLKVLAIDPSGMRSRIYTEKYDFGRSDIRLQVNFPSGTYLHELEIKFNSDPLYKIFYSTDAHLKSDQFLRYDPENPPLIRIFEGETQLRFFAENDSGQRSTVYQADYRVDLTAPQVNLNIEHIKKEIKLTFQSDEPGTIHYALLHTGDSSVKEMKIYSNPVFLFPDKVQQIQYWATDLAGNKTILFQQKLSNDSSKTSRLSLPEQITAQLSLPPDTLRPKLDRDPPTVAVFPLPGIYGEIVNIHLTTNEPSTLYYILNDSSSAAVFTIYDGPLLLNKDQNYLIRYYAEDRAGNKSPPQVIRYTINSQPLSIQVSPRGGYFNSSVLVQVSANKPGWIYFSINGNPPTAQRPRHELPYSIKIEKTSKFSYFVVDYTNQQSEIFSENYEISREKAEVSINFKSGYYRVPLKLNFMTEKSNEVFYAFDPLLTKSEFKKYQQSDTLLLADGHFVVRYYARNKFGNESALKEVQYWIDTIPPMIRIDKIVRDDQPVIILKSNEKATIYYSLDGKEPSEKSLVYQHPLQFTGRDKVLIWCFSKDLAGNSSEKIKKELYLIQRLPQLKINHASGLYNRPLDIILQSDQNARIFYTLNGQLPSLNSLLYKEKLTISSEGKSILTAIAINDENFASKVLKSEFFIDRTPPKINFEITGDKLENTVSIILKPEEEALIYYSKNPKQIESSALPYHEPIQATKNEIIAFFGVDLAGNRSKNIYIQDLVAPLVTAEPTGKVYRHPISVELRCDRQAEIYYTVDGTIPTMNSLKYNGAIALEKEGNNIVEFFAVSKNGSKSTIVKENYYLDMQVPKLEFDFKPSRTMESVDLTFFSNENISVYYTLDGSNPLTSSKVRVAGNKFFSSKALIRINRKQDTSLKYYAQDIAGNQTEVQTLDISGPAVTPSIPPGLYPTIISLSLKTLFPATIYYTIDGTIPNKNSATFDKPIAIAKTLILKCFAVDEGGNQSSVIESKYIIDAKPRADFEWIPAQVNVETPIDFSARSSYDLEDSIFHLYFRWDWESDGNFKTNFSNEPKAKYRFASPGEKQVTLEVKDRHGNIGTVSKTILISPLCEPGMVGVVSNEFYFCMDRFEWPNIENKLPQTQANWIEANMKCKSVGKSLCTKTQWLLSCQGRTNNLFPYGNRFEQNHCNIHAEKVQNSKKYLQCQSEYGIFDLSGNVWEWVADIDGGLHIAYGGGFDSGNHSECHQYFPASITFKNEATGFRCCK